MSHNNEDPFVIQKMSEKQELLIAEENESEQEFSNRIRKQFFENAIADADVKDEFILILFKPLSENSIDIRTRTLLNGAPPIVIVAVLDSVLRGMIGKIAEQNVFDKINIPEV